MILDKFSIVVTTRCDLRCDLCDEFIPDNKPFPDLTVAEAERILDSFFEVVSHVKLLHLSGGGEPFLNKDLGKLVEACFKYEDRFDQLMVFTNSTIIPSDELLEALEKHRDKVIVHASNYGIKTDISKKVYALLNGKQIPLREVKYYGEEQDYGGWVDFGPWDSRNRSEDELNKIFRNCGITKYMNGNWRTRDGKVHWCQRSQRGMELGLIPEVKTDFVDLFDETLSTEEKQKLFSDIENGRFLSACDYCSGNHGTEDKTKRFPAGRQMGGAK